MAATSTTTRKALRPTSRDDFEIAIVCAKDLEYDAVCLLVDGFWNEDGDSFGRAIGDPNTYTTVAAASTAASLRSSYPCIKLLLLIGTCDGVPNAMGKELLLGDVVISDTVVQYDLGRRYPNGFRERDTLEDRLGRPDKNVRNLVAMFKTEMGLQRLEKKVSSYLRKIQDMETKEQRRKRRRATYQYPGSTNDILFRSTYYHKHYRSPQCICDDHNEAGDPVCDHLLPRLRLEYKKKLEDDGDEKAAQQPSIFVGRFGSGDTDFNSAIDRDHIAQKHNIIAFETEGAGVWDELSCIIIKGVSTYGDGHIMSDLEAWENFAAATAASAARGLIDFYPQTDRYPSVESKNQTDIAFKSQADIICLRDLYITSPPNDRIRIEQTKGGLLMDAFVWILRNEAYKQWCEDPQTCLLWIRGDPGKGKTMLLCGIIDHLQDLTPSTNLYYFFYQATDSRLNNAISHTRTITHAYF
ncbi:NACHT domain-containing protein [Trichoderma breve]|uniref:NACHT domain-containing protein n=1 Tax=Trichoderma breve TaxID=2034170 RepID=A0A9W9B363_9HYPO|nr:NACHT domain-containing protein [Trichoderma breve]KAJ4855010.1 NACHT domain-containing protein [Trichoderma breve]